MGERNKSFAGLKKFLKTNMLTIMGKGRLNWMKEGECRGRASGTCHLSRVSEDQVGPDRQIKDGDSFPGWEESWSKLMKVQGGPSWSVYSECARGIYGLCTICWTQGRSEHRLWGYSTDFVSPLQCPLLHLGTGGLKKGATSKGCCD